MPNIKLQSSDGVVMEVDVEIAKLSVTIKTMLENLVMMKSSKEWFYCLTLTQRFWRKWPNGPLFIKTTRRRLLKMRRKRKGQMISDQEMQTFLRKMRALFVKSWYQKYLIVFIENIIAEKILNNNALKN